MTKAEMLASIERMFRDARIERERRLKEGRGKAGFYKGHQGVESPVNDKGAFDTETDMERRMP